MNNNFNLDENTMNNIKNMVDNGDFSGAISQISPEMIENVSKMLNNQKNSDIPNNSNQNNFNNSGNSNQSNFNNSGNSNQNNFNNSSNSNQNNFNNSSNSNQNNFNNFSNSNQNDFNNSSNSNQNNSNIDFNSIDPAMIMKITSAFGKMNNNNDPRSNLLYSLKPYLRDGRKEKLDQYVNLINISKVADILKDDKKENKNG